MKKFFLLFLVAAAIPCGAVPQYINYQGYLTRTDGSPLDTTVSMTFTIYNAPVGGSVMWTETRASVLVSGGLFNASLGSVTPLPDMFTANRYLAIQVGNDTEMIPRQPITSVANAYRVGTLDGASGGTISGDVNIAGKANIGSGNDNSGGYAFVSGVNNTASGIYSNVGGNVNSATYAWTTVAGGWNNVASANASAVGGGQSNLASGDLSLVGGGLHNIASGAYSFVGGGSTNRARGESSVVVGGGAWPADSNSAAGDYSFVGGGKHNRASGDSTCVSGGATNTGVRHSLDRRRRFEQHGQFNLRDGRGRLE
jgi:hypothetical protein